MVGMYTIFQGVETVSFLAWWSLHIKGTVYFLVIFLIRLPIKHSGVTTKNRKNKALDPTFGCKPSEICCKYIHD